MTTITRYNFSRCTTGVLRFFVKLCAISHIQPWRLRVVCPSSAGTVSALCLEVSPSSLFLCIVAYINAASEKEMPDKPQTEDHLSWSPRWPCSSRFVFSLYSCCVRSHVARTGESTTQRKSERTLTFFFHYSLLRNMHIEWNVEKNFSCTTSISKIE